MTLPTFVVVGAQKAGTTSARANLAQHPDIAMTPRGEVHYFCCHRTSPNEAKAYAKALNYPPSAKHKPHRGERTPHYLRKPSSLVRMAKVLPEAKIIVFLRDPVDRVASRLRMSNLQWSVQTARDKIDSAGIKTMGKNRLSESLYAEQLKQLQALYPRRQILYVWFERVCENPLREYNRIFCWLGLRPLRATEFRNHHIIPNVRTPPQKPFADDRVAEELARFLQSDVAQLEELCGEQPPWPRFFELPQ